MYGATVDQMTLALSQIMSHRAWLLSRPAGQLGAMLLRHYMYGMHLIRRRYFQ